IYACMLLSIAVTYPLSVSAQASKAQCDACKSTARPYLMCVGGKLVTQCLVDPWTVPNDIPALSPVPPCWDDSNAYTSDILNKTFYDYHDSTYDTSFQYWQDTTVYDYDPADSQYDISVDTLVYDNTDSTILIQTIDSTVVPIFIKSQLLGVNGDIESSLNQWLSVCGKSISDSTSNGDVCCVHVVESTNPALFGNFPTDLNEVGATTAYRFDPTNCNMLCTGVYVSLNFTTDFIVHQIGVGGVHYALYSGTTVPNLNDPTSGLNTHVASIRSILTHEFGHWFGFPNEDQWDTVNCPPPYGDLMSATSINIDAPPQGISSWDSCWFKILYCCCGECPVERVHQQNNDGPSTTLLLKTYPNPVLEGHMAIDFQTANAGAMHVDIYDMNGRKINTAFAGYATEDSHYVIDYDTQNLPSGQYKCILQQENRTAQYTFVVKR
ncbi:MAG TPA: T9SS type A sorting domain-containing protein, partial [Candidatus Kapabacteria bacterium]|nr:T9SS type A sorting domain-containing protein [Candidatus Kapabacteria bacterium]